MVMDEDCEKLYLEACQFPELGIEHRGSRGPHVLAARLGNLEDDADSHLDQHQGDGRCVCWTPSPGET
jgi:hypothetical protein